MLMNYSIFGKFLMFLRQIKACDSFLKQVIVLKRLTILISGRQMLTTNLFMKIKIYENSHICTAVER